jgi:hypothetical protein
LLQGDHGSVWETVSSSPIECSLSTAERGRSVVRVCPQTKQPSRAPSSICPPNWTYTR